MSFIKSSKLWANLVLVCSLLCVATVLVAIFGFRAGAEWMSFRTAGDVIRLVVQIGLGLLAVTVIVFCLALYQNEGQRLKSAIALAIVSVMLYGVISNQPEGTTLFATAPSGPPAAGMGAGMGSDAPARTPPLNDISTDTMDPPQYSAVVSLRPEGSNTLEYPAHGPEVQAQLFPDIAPIETTLSFADAFTRAEEVADDMGWEIVSADADSGMIEAVASTFFFGFKDDVVIRVRADGEGSVVDIRSHSRIGRGDRGKNAERVRKYIEEFG